MRVDAGLKSELWNSPYPPPETEEDFAAAQQRYLESDTRKKLIGYKLDEVVKKYPNVRFEPGVLQGPGDRMDLVRGKFDHLRGWNTEEEDKLRSKHTPAKKGSNIHYGHLIEFLWAYIKALGLREREIEFIKRLPDILNDELGNFTGDLTEIPGLFMEGVGKGLSAGVKAVMSVADDLLKGVAEGLGIDPEQLKIIIGAIVGFAILAFIGVGVSRYTQKRRIKKISKQRNS